MARVKSQVLNLDLDISAKLVYVSKIMMYTLKVEPVTLDFMQAAQALVQENKTWQVYEFEFDFGRHVNSVTLGTTSIRELKRLVDMLESEDFMRGQEDFKEYLEKIYS